MNQEEIILATINIETPVWYDDTCQNIFDDKHNCIADVRNFKRFQHIENGSDIQDAIGRYICELINHGLIF